MEQGILYDEKGMEINEILLTMDEVLELLGINESADWDMKILTWNDTDYEPNLCLRKHYVRVKLPESGFVMPKFKGVRYFEK